MKELFTSMLQALSDGQSVVLCSILASSGSTPRGAGAKMAVFADGHTVGTIGGGAVEKCSGEKALEVLQSKQSLVQGYCLAPNQVADIGMICGGNVTVYFQYFDPADENGRALLQGILELLRGDEPAGSSTGWTAAASAPWAPSTRPTACALRTASRLRRCGRCCFPTRSRKRATPAIISSL